MSRGHDGDWISKDDLKDKSGLYVSSGNCDVESKNSIMEAFLMKIVKVSESKESFFKEIKANILGFSQKVESNMTTIKQHGQKFRQLAATLISIN